MQALDMIGGKNITLLMDSHLDGKFSTEEATLVFELASQCLQYEPRDRPSIKELVAALVPLQNKSDVSVCFFNLWTSSGDWLNIMSVRLCTLKDYNPTCSSDTSSIVLHIWVSI